MDLFSVVHARRSHPILSEPGPASADVDKLIDAALAAPDHGRRSPWRFVILEGEGKKSFADVIEKAYRARSAAADCAESKVVRERQRLERAPMVIVSACVASDDDRIPWREQFAAAAAATQNLLLAATALGFGTIWRTGWLAADPIVKAALELEAGDDIVGFVYIGTVPPDRPPPRRPSADRGAACWTWPKERGER